MPPKKPNDQEVKKGVEKLVKSKRKPPVNTLVKSANKEIKSRAQNISSVAGSVSKLKSSMDKQIVEIQKYSSNKSINQVQSSMTKVLEGLSQTIGNLATGVKDITLKTAKASKDAIGEYGRAISEGAF